MPWFYVTVRKTEIWNVAVEAENEDSAKDLADEQADFEPPDYVDWEYEAEQTTKLNFDGD